MSKYSTSKYLAGFLEQMFKFQKGTHNETNCIQVSVHIQLDDIDYRDFINGFKSDESETIKELLISMFQKNVLTSKTTIDINSPITELNISLRVYNILYYAKIKTILELINISESELSSYRRMGKKSLQELKNELERYSLYLKK
jgi:DNA-directed RNA polymerase alpha subunit